MSSVGSPSTNRDPRAGNTAASQIRRTPHRRDKTDPFLLALTWVVLTAVTYLNVLITVVNYFGTNFTHLDLSYNVLQPFNPSSSLTGNSQIKEMGCEEHWRGTEREGWKPASLHPQGLEANHDAMLHSTAAGPSPRIYAMDCKHRNRIPQPNSVTKFRNQIL